VSYSVARRFGAEEDSTDSLEAESAVRVLRDWTRAFPHQLLVIRDETGHAVAYRRPANTPGASGWA